LNSEPIPAPDGSEIACGKQKSTRHACYPGYKPKKHSSNIIIVVLEIEILKKTHDFETNSFFFFSFLNDLVYYFPRNKKINEYSRDQLNMNRFLIRVS